MSNTPKKGQRVLPAVSVFTLLLLVIRLVGHRTKKTPCGDGSELTLKLLFEDLASPPA